jgi:bifunctional DNA-binding transcriptional regulator/antitoxin component of YhaV-PrlF toxin-antitoxin module
MKYATFITEVIPEQKIQIPKQVSDKIMLEPGDRVEVSIKKIKSKKLEILLSENPLYKLLKIAGYNKT